MKIASVIVPLLAIAIAPGVASAACPAMGVYELNSVTAHDLPLQSAMDLLTEGTAWHAVVKGSASSVKVSFQGVSGPLDDVIDVVLSKAGVGGDQVASTADPSSCTVTVSLRPAPVEPVVDTQQLAASPSVVVPKLKLQPVASEHSGLLHKGQRLSVAMADYVKTFGWSLRWRIDKDYVLDADVPVPPMSLIDGVTWIVRVYQSNNGLQGVVPKINKGNNVVSIIPMDSPDGEGRY